MSGLRDRLNRLASKSGTEKEPKRTHSESLGTEWEEFGAFLECNEWGAFIKRTVRYPLEYEHGRNRLGDLWKHAEGLTALHPESSPSPESLLFYDTETTGLGVGAGNVPFMIGIGFFESGSFIVEQMFIRNPAEETAMLYYLSGMLSRFTHLVSYNGRTFDWPIIKNRFILNRLEEEWEEPVQLDFLYPSRSLWKHTMPSCRLGKVEEQQLGFHRMDDVPGSMAPALYFQYLAENDPSVIRGVFVHNEFDILSLCGLAVHFSRALTGDLFLPLLEGEELFRLGLWLDKMGKEAYSEEVFQLLLDRSAEEAGAYYAPLAAHYKKKKAEGKAFVLWQKAAARQTGQSLVNVEPLIELAMHYEHKQKNYEAALRFAEDALERALRRSSFTRMSVKQQELVDGLRKRVDRLRRKTGRTRSDDGYTGTLF